MYGDKVVFLVIGLAIVCMYEYWVSSIYSMGNMGAELEGKGVYE